MYDDQLGVCGFVDCDYGIGGVDGNADGADGNSGRQFDEDCDDCVRAVGDLPDVVVSSSRNDGSVAVLQLDGACGNHGDGI